MGLIPKVKCSRCDKSYSGLKNKCPHCGAHRARGGKRAADTGDASARFMIKILLLLALVVAVISMIVINFDDEPSGGTTLGPGPVITGTNETNENESEGGEADEDGNIIPNPEPTPTPAPTPPPVEATSLDIRWQFWAAGVNEITIRVGDEIDVWAHIFPTDATGEPRFVTSDSNVVNLRVDPEDVRNVELLGRSMGTAVITVTVDDLEAELIVRVRS